MALLTRMIKKSLTAFAAMLLLALPAQAATFSMKRGLSMELWTSWPDEKQWDQPMALLPFPEWRKTLTAADLAAVKASGFDFVRLPVDPAVFLSDKTTLLRDALYDDVLASARMINAAGLKVVVDLHIIPAGGNRAIGTVEVTDDPAMFDRYLDMVRTMAGRLAGENPEQMALELMNEPGFGCDAGDTTWSDHLKRLHEAARAEAPKLSLVLSGGCSSNAEGLVAVDPGQFPDDNIIWTFHSYQPFLLTHQGASWAGDFIRYVTGIPYPPSALSKPELDAVLEAIRQRIRSEAPVMRRSGMLYYLDEEIAKLDTPEKLQAAVKAPFDQVDEWARRHGVEPETIFLGEFGMIRQEWGSDWVMPAASRVAYIKEMIGLAESRGYSWAIWSYSGPFGIVQAFSGETVGSEILDMVKALD